MNIEEIRAAAEAACPQHEEDLPHVPDLSPLGVQDRIALRNCGRIVPGSIDQYIIRGQGFAGLSRALLLSKDRVKALVLLALRGRGGSGFSTAGKIQDFHAATGNKYAICNAVDTEPGPSATKLLLEGDPFSVLEGMLISAFAGGASNCLIYVNAGRDVRRKLGEFLKQMKDYGLLGRGILDSEFSAELEIEEVPDSLVSAHRSEILRYMDNVPVAHPVYPGMQRFTACPSAIYSPEAMAALSGLLPDGMGDRTGTKVVTLSGSVVHKCAAEVAFGTSIRCILETLGGGIPDGKKIRAVQLGGPAGTLIDSTGLDIQVGCASSEESHSNIGSGEIQVFDTDMSAAEVVRSTAARIHDQSCGRCVLCFEASRQISEILADIAGGKNDPRDPDLLHELSDAMQTGHGCTFGRAAAENILSSLKLMRI